MNANDRPANKVQIADTNKTSLMDASRILCADRKGPLQFFPIDSLASLYSGFRLAPIQVEPCTRKTRVETHEPHLAAGALRQFCWRGSPSIDGGREIAR